MAALSIASLAWLAMFGATPAAAGMADQPDAALRASYTSLGERLHHNAFGRTLALDSSESPTTLKGDIHALVDYPFPTVRAALDDPAHWCDVLILHINTKHCRAGLDPGDAVLAVWIGRKTPQPLKDAYPIELTYRLAGASERYLDIRLHAPEGPLSTRNYQIQLQAIPVGSRRTFLRLTYSYDYGTAGRLAMKLYLAARGSGKVGFSPTGSQSNGQPEYIDGMRGVVERNAMRYYLAIDAYLEALTAPVPRRLQRRLDNWFAATEQYPRQLREVDRTDYMTMKRHEIQRRQTAP